MRLTKSRFSWKTKNTVQDLLRGHALVASTEHGVDRNSGRRQPYGHGIQYKTTQDEAPPRELAHRESSYNR